MADKLADLSPEEKQKRIAEMKAKMQESAKKAKAAAAASAEAPTAPKPEAAVAAAATTAAIATAVVTEAPAETAKPETKPEVVPATNGGATNSATVSVATTATTVVTEPAYVEETAEQKAKKEMNRREFLTYAWGGALGLLLIGAGAGTFFFMYPRFKAGEFGGVFMVGPESSMPATDAPPVPYTAGKFWLVNAVDEGPKALYMVCTHLGCLYKWAQSNNRFECPCHGSKFTKDGYYIEGPAPRSLDTFVVEVTDGVIYVDTGAKESGAPAAESPARAVPA